METSWSVWCDRPLDIKTNANFAIRTYTRYRPWDPTSAWTQDQQPNGQKADWMWYDMRSTIYNPTGIPSSFIDEDKSAAPAPNR